VPKYVPTSGIHRPDEPRCSTVKKRFAIQIRKRKIVKSRTTHGTAHGQRSEEAHSAAVEAIGDDLPDLQDVQAIRENSIEDFCQLHSYAKTTKGKVSCVRRRSHEKDSRVKKKSAVVESTREESADCVELSSAPTTSTSTVSRVRGRSSDVHSRQHDSRKKKKSAPVATIAPSRLSVSPAPPFSWPTCTTSAVPAGVSAAVPAAASGGVCDVNHPDKQIFEVALLEKNPQVEKCYACRKPMKPHVHNVMLKTYTRRSYVDKTSKMPTMTQSKVPVYYHLNVNCIRSTNPLMELSEIVVHEETRQHLSVSNRAALVKFGVKV
jgi:hypothetical protein